jgi:hypothetical protein
MKEIRGSIDIDAPVGRVWEVMTDFKAYPQWNPFITKMSGELKEGSIFDVTVKIPGRKDSQFKSKLVKIVEKQELMFNGTIKKGILTDDHLFKLESFGENKTKMFQSIAFKGFMSYFAGSTIKDVQKGLDMMNSAFKVRCEAQKK